jgi:hypothetical protein
LCGLIEPNVIVPIHYEGWNHFRQQGAAARSVFDGSPVADKVRWLEAGAPADLQV